MVAATLILWGFGVGAVFLGVGLPLGLSVPYIYSKVLQDQLELTSDSQTFSEWNDNPVPIYMEFYMWDWVNAEEFSRDYTVKPAFKEVGPFTFRVKTKRVNVTWNADRTVTFAPARTYTFQPDMSLDLNTPITSLSPVPAVLAYYSRFWKSSFFRLVINKEVEIREKIYQTDTAGNWMFYGIQDSLLDLIVPMKEIADLPLPFDKFAWFYGRNQSATAEGTFTIQTGTDDLSNLGNIVLWKDSPFTDYPGSCGRVGGSTGELLHPMKEVPKTLSVFSADICSQLTLEYKGEKIKNDVTGWEFVGSEMSFDDGSRYPEGECFCEGECVPSGTRNISRCKFNAPAFVSFPHFHLADETYRSRIQGMKPDDSHKFSLVVEPTTGVPLSVRAQLQVNLLIRHSDAVGLYSGLPELYIPMLWFRERADITPELARMLFWVVTIPTVGYGLLFSMAAVGIIMLSAAFYFSRKTGTSLPLTVENSAPDLSAAPETMMPSSKEFYNNLED